jgi:hypothetical protein
MQVKTIRTGDQIQISDLRAEGDVHAYRAPTAGDENSLKITGQKLWVTDAQGDAAQARIDGAPAHVESDALTLEGNNINLDYAKNHVWVNGVGMLAMPVAWDPAGGEPADKKPMEVRWQRRMFFNGEVAEFGGDVKIDADNRRVRCQSAQVTLAEPISFRDPPKQGSDRVNLKQVLCEERVVLDADVIEAGEIQGRDHAEVERFELHNGTGEMTADGPGIFVQTRRGMADPLAPGPPNPAAPNRRQGPSARAVSQRRSDTLDAPAEGRLTEAGEGDNAIRYTRIEFEDSMKGNTQDRRTRFFNRVEVTYGPVEDFDGVVDPNHLPDKALWMRSEELEVSQRPLQADGTRPVEMRASGKVRVEANAFFADADRLDYDEAKDMFVLEGSPRDPATLWRQQRLGAPVSSQRARKFIYWRQNGRIQVFDAQDGNFLDLPAPNRR